MTAAHAVYISIESWVASRLLTDAVSPHLFAGWWLTPTPCSTAVRHVDSICVRSANADGAHGQAMLPQYPSLRCGWSVAGDTCQTIARGIGFRFADIRTLFFEQSQRRKVCKIWVRDENPY